MKKQIISTALAIGLLTTGFTSIGSAQASSYKVKHGDTLYRIATNYNLTVEQLMEYNQLSSPIIYPDQILTLNAHSNTKSSSTYTVRAGDTLYSIAKQNGITVSELKSINQLTSNNINVGQVLKISGKAPQTTPTSYYTVKKGDTLWSIANKHGLTVAQLKSLNHLSTNTISIGQKLTVSSDKNDATVKTYTVQRGDTLYSISKKFGISVNQLKSYNQLNTNLIHVGQVLKLDGKSGQAPKTNPFNVDALIAEGKKYIGTPYKWGGTSPAGFDCSGFLYYIYKQQGKTIPRTVETIWNAAKTVSSPQKGDLAFFETYKAGPSHASVYLGNNKFLHAGTSTGVTITSMDNPYWKARYLGAKSI